ncbi:MaoC family dehydratase N-terminal domain-containing protein [Nocardia sp. NPDC058518]|uniref:MaoC family dehydratase N-terminal domain-containing protein n=1 Tax=Nocardia sp. NPDC058518 TaxID=3346534 RepID=UPI00364EEEE8
MTDLIDRDSALRLLIEPVVFEMERGRLRFFAETIGLTDPVYLDRAAAQMAGHPDVVVPPTFLGNALELELPQPLSWLAALGVNLDRTTHGEQAFEYHNLAFAGDTLTFHRSIADVYIKKGGALEFVVKRTRITRNDGTPIADALCTLGVFHQEAGR